MVDQCPIPPGTANGPPSHWYDTWDRSSSKSFSAKGLRNAPGENNCFLNSAVQVFWHLDVFRRSYRRLTGHLCMGNSCIFCGIKVIFTQFQYSDQSSLPPDTLRKALAETFANQQRFQLGHMDDAAECFENILRRIHFHIANNYNEDACTAPHCLPHAKFAMKVFDQLVCVCGSKSDPLTFHEMVHYISTNALVNQCRSMQETGDVLHPDRFGLQLRNAAAVGDIRDCPGGCGKRVQIRRTLLNCPDVVSIGLVWNSDRPDAEMVSAVARSIGTTILLQDVFHSVMCNDVTKLPKLQLAAMVCYYGKHYSTFVYHTKLNVWIYFDDATVREIGPRWEHVVDKCVQGHYQPLLLLYANPAGNPVLTDTAPKKRVMAPGYSTPSKGSADKEQRKGEMTLDINDGKNGARRSITPNPDLHNNMDQAAKNRRSITPGPDLQSPEEEKGRKPSVEHHRHNSFLIAVTGKNDKNKQNPASHYQVPMNTVRQPLVGGQGQVEGYSRMPSLPEKGESVRQQYQQDSMQNRVDQSALDEYNYTLSNSDQYRRPSVGSPDQNKFPLTLNFSRAAEAQRKESFKKGKGKIGADVIRFSVDSKSSSDSDSPVFPDNVKGQGSSDCVPPSLPPKQIKRSHSHNEESLANISADNIDIRQHIVIKPKSSAAHIYENIENLMHSPVQSGLATLPRNKKPHPTQSHSHVRQGSMHGESESYNHSRQNSSNEHRGSNSYNCYGQNSWTQNSVQGAQIIHSNQSSTSTLTEDPNIHWSRHSSIVSQTSQSIEMVQKQQQQSSNTMNKPLHSRQSSSVVSEPNQKTSGKEKPPKPAKPEKKSSLQKKKTNQCSQGPPPPPLPEKRKPSSPQSPDKDSYIDRRMVESVLSRQKLSRQGSSVSTSSQNSNNSFDSDSFTSKSSTLSVEIPFDRVSLESQQPSDSGYGSSDRNSSSSTGSATLDPYTQYFLSKSMIPPKTFNQQAVAENMKKFMNNGHSEKQSYTVGSQYGYHQDNAPQYPPGTSCYGGKSYPSSSYGNEQGQRSEQHHFDQSADKRQLYDPAIVKSHTQNKDSHMYHMTQKIPVHDSRGPTTSRPNHPQEGLDKINPKVGAPAPQSLHTYNEASSSPCENNQFMILCKKGEDFMDQCMLAETGADNSKASNYCNAAADCFKQAMKLPNISQQSFTFAQKSHNSCILKFRSLQKKFVMRQESTSSSDSARSSPLPSYSNASMSYSTCDNRHGDQKCINQVISSHHMDTVHSRSSSKDSVDSVIENKNYRKDRNSVHSENRNSSNSDTSKLTSNNSQRNNMNNENPSQNKLTLSKSNQNLNERTFVSGSENIDIYATLPRKPKKLNNNRGLMNSQDPEGCKEFSKTDSYQHGRTSSTGSTTPTPMDNRESDFNHVERNDSSQFQFDVSAQQPVKMNKAEIRQLLHTNMVQKQGNFPKGPDPNKNRTSSANSNQHYIENKSQVLGNQSNDDRIPSRPLTPQLSGNESSATSNNDDFRPSVRALASRFEAAPTSNADNNSSESMEFPPGGQGLGNRHRSKSESDFRAMEMKPKSVLSKKRKSHSRKPTKSVTFSDNIALIAATDGFLTGNANQSDNTHLGYVSDDEEKYYHFRRSHSDNECEDDDSSTSVDSPTEPMGDETCSLCNKKGVVEGLIYCSKCQVYMSRFRPEYC